MSTEYIAAPTPSPAGAGSGGGSKPVSAEKLMAQVRSCQGLALYFITGRVGYDLASSRF